MLDAVDAELVRALQGDGRATYQALAQSVGLSRTAVRARVRRLVGAGAIRIVGVAHAGITGMKVFAHISFGIHGSADRLLRDIEHRGAVTFAAHTAGRTPVVAHVRVPSDAALAAELAELRRLPSVSYTEVFRGEAVVKDAHAPAREPRETAVDPLDWRLIRQLEADGRASYADLARRVGLSQAAARSRVVRLIGEGLVHVTALLEPAAMGANEHLGFGARCRGDAWEMAARLGKLPGVTFIASGFGRFDAVGCVTAADRPGMVEALEVIRASPEVSELETWAHLAVVKDHRSVVLDRESVNGERTPSGAPGVSPRTSRRDGGDQPDP